MLMSHNGIYREEEEHYIHQANYITSETCYTHLVYLCDGNGFCVRCLVDGYEFLYTTNWKGRKNRTSFCPYNHSGSRCVIYSLRSIYNICSITKLDTRFFLLIFFFFFFLLLLCLSCRMFSPAFDVVRWPHFTSFFRF
jgi:hypothetical protein